MVKAWTVSVLAAVAVFGAMAGFGYLTNMSETEPVSLPAQVGGAPIALYSDEHYALYVDGQPFAVTLAADDETRRQGLSGTEPLRDREGKFFIFDRNDNFGFWMKDMNYAIDIIWFDANGYVVHIESNVAPDTYPETFFPNTQTRYVLEVMAGESSRFGLNVGDRLQLSAGLISCLRNACYNQ